MSDAKVNLTQQNPGAESGAEPAERMKKPAESMKKPAESMTVQEAGRRGGMKTAERHGHDFYEKIGKKGGEARKQALGPKGYEELGRRGGQRVRDLIARGLAGETKAASGSGDET